MSAPHFKRYFAIMLIGYAIWLVLYFFSGWVGSLRGPAFDAALPIDAAIPFVPDLLPIYLLCYLITLAVFLISTEAAILNRAYVALIAANASAFLFFMAFPVLGPERAHFTSDGSLLHSLLELSYNMDSRYNAFPSLHNANPWLVALLASKYANRTWVKALCFAIAIAISAATLFVKQHYVLDMAAGIVLAVVCYVVAVKARISEKPW